ncbi:MAG: hypothetical protein M3209_19700 [Acidobacteriota bacterium]|nr:hypothetical protein [Acidobacteriota bacterium]
MLSKTASGLLFLLFAFVLCVPAQQQSIEYGQPSELRGVTKIFVDTGVNVEQRDQIAKQIKKRLTNLEIVSRPEESDFHLRFTAKNESDEVTGTLVKIINKNRVRILFSFKSFPVFQTPVSTADFEMRYAKPTVFAVQFVKLYKKANGES